MKVQAKDIQFYLDRINFYFTMLSFFENGTNIDSSSELKGFGELEFYMDQVSHQWTYDFWVKSMIRYIEKESRKKSSTE